MGKTAKTNTLFLGVVMFYLGGSIFLSWLLNYVIKTSLPVWASIVISQMLIFVPMCVYLKINNEKVKELIPYKKMSISNFLICILFAILLIPVVIFINMISMLFVKNELQGTVGVIYEYPFILQVILLAIIPPVFEEFAFRGVFFHSFRRNNILGAAILSGVMFGLIHLNFNQFAYAFVLGIVFAMLVEATGSMFSSMTAHFVINMNSVVWMAIYNFIEKFLENNSELLEDTTLQIDTTTTMEATSLASFPKEILIIYVIILLGMAIVFGVLAFLVFRWLSIRNGRWQHIKEVVKDTPFKKKKENFIDLPLVFAIAICIGYMFLVEYL